MRIAYAWIIVASGCLSAWAQVQPAPAKAAPALGFGSGENRSLFATKPKIEDLLKQDRFTNSTEMTMVKVSSQFWAGQTLVTQEQFQKVMGTNPSQFRGARHPVDTVSWTDALNFCARLTDLERKAEMLPENLAYTLPTQGEWEGLLGGATLQTSVTSIGAAVRNGSSPVATLPPNSLGLYDARGNLWQWCLDPLDKPYRVLRGGAWNEMREVNLRPEFRWYSNGTEERQNIFGFRVVLAPAGTR